MKACTKSAIKFLFVIFLFTGNFQLIASAGDNRTMGSQESAMGISSSSIVNVFSAGNNQAGMAFLEKAGVGIFYSNSFTIKGLNDFSLAVAVPFKKGGAIGLDVNYFGYSQFNDKKIGLSYSIKLAKFLSIGAQLDFLNTKIGNDYGSKNFFTFELGLVAKPFEELTIGAHIYNPLRLKIDDATDEILPTILKLGLTYNIKDQFFITVETEKSIRAAFVFRAGFDYRPIDLLSIRAGIATDPTMGTFGFGLNVKDLHIDVGTSYHPDLGFSPNAGISYEF